MMFAAPADMTLEWQESGVEGAHRFLKRLYRQVAEHCQLGKVNPVAVSQYDDQQKALRRDLHKTIAKVADDIERRHAFNTAVAAIMELMNKLTKAPNQPDNWRALMQEALTAIVQTLYPFTPHICFVLWQQLTEVAPQPLAAIDQSQWPAADPQAMVDDTKLI